MKQRNKQKYSEMLFSSFLLHGRPERVGHVHVCFVCVVLILSTLTVAAVVTQLVTVHTDRFKVEMCHNHNLKIMLLRL